MDLAYDMKQIRNWLLIIFGISSARRLSRFLKPGKSTAAAAAAEWISSNVRTRTNK
jgi:hypothetical protein